MKKALIFLLVVVFAIVIACVYGIVHDELTYTISAEYYTKFKFLQFGLYDSFVPGQVNNPRLDVIVVGLMATWWMGLLIGSVLGIAGLIYLDTEQFLRISINAFLLVVYTAFALGLAGLAYGKLYLARKGVNWSLPENLVNTADFISVGSMHNFSYAGGVLGFIIGMMYLRSRRKSKQKS